MPFSKLTEILRSKDEHITITGPAAETFRPMLEESPDVSVDQKGFKTVDRKGLKPFSFIPPDSAKPSARSIAELGLIMFISGGSVHPASLKPLYLRRSDAEIARDSRNNISCP